MSHFLISLFIISFSLAQWRVLENSPGANSRHDDIYFINEQIGWVVNLEGKVYKTLNGGENWFKQFDDDNYQFRSVGFINEFRGWAGTLDGSVLMETFDGGSSWSQVPNLPVGPVAICGIAVVNTNVVYVSGWYNGPEAYILKTVDGGNNWSLIDMRTVASSLIDIHFFSPDTGFVVGGSAGAGGDLYAKSAVVLQTVDGGQNWSVKHQTTRISEWGWKLSFPSRNVGFVSIESFNTDFPEGHILKTIDGGEHWVEYPVNFKRVQGIGFADENTGWLSGWGSGSRASFNGGVNWSNFVLGEHLNKFRFLNDSIGYAVGQRVYKYERWKNTNPPKIPPTLTVLRQNDPNPFNDKTRISYSLKDPAYVELTIYDIMGRKIKTLFKGSQDADNYSYIFDGSRLASGVYFCSILVNQKSQAIEMVKLRYTQN